MPTQRALREYGLTAEDLTEQGEDVSFDFGENSGGGYSGEVVFQAASPLYRENDFEKFLSEGEGFYFRVKKEDFVFDIFHDNAKSKKITTEVWNMIISAIRNNNTKEIRWSKRKQDAVAEILLDTEKGIIPVLVDIKESGRVIFKEADLSSIKKPAKAHYPNKGLLSLVRHYSSSGMKIYNKIISGEISNSIQEVVSDVKDNLAEDLIFESKEKLVGIIKRTKAKIENGIKGEYNKSNFGSYTDADFKSVDVDNYKVEKISKDSGSEYWYGTYQGRDGVFRRSDHWGKGIRNSNWTLDGKESRGSFKIGFAAWSDFKYNNEEEDRKKLTKYQNALEIKEKEEKKKNGKFFQFGGPQAENADTLALGKAKEMEQSGTDGETIRRQTGWFKGADGKWRFEISDKEAEILPSALEHFAKYLAAKYESSYAYRESEELRQNPTKYKPEVQKELIKIYENNLKKANQEMFELGDELRLGDVLKHDKLFKAYPYLRDVKITVSDMDASGSYYPYHNEIVLDADMFDARKHKYNKAYPQEKRTAEIKKVLMHEIQHAIQEKEGFAKGGNPEQFADRTRQAEIKRDLTKLKEREQAGEDVSEEIAQAEFELNSIKEGQTDKYLHLAGEMEARNTERRANLSEQERQDTPPQDTQDYKDSDAIVVFGGTQTAYHAWYEAPYKNFGSFFDAVKNNNRPNNKSFYIYKIKNGLNIVIPSDSVVNNSKFSKMASEEWQDVLDNIDNIKNGFVSNDKKGAMYKGYPIYLKIERNKNFYGVLLEYTNNNKLILTKIFKDFDEKNIDEWIKERESVRTPETFIFKIRPTTNKSRRPTTPDRSPYTFLTYIVQKVKRYKENNNETNTPYIVVTKNSIGSLREKKTRKEILSDINYKNFNEDFKSNSIPEKINAIEKYIKTVLEEYGFDYKKTEKSEKSNSRYVYFKDKNAGEIIYGFRVSDHKYISKYEKRFPDRVQHLNTEQRLEEIAGIVDNYLSKPNTQQQNDNYETVLGSFEGGEEPVITLGEKANFSTLLHEFAHFLHYDMKQALAEHPNDKTLAQEMEVLRKWYGGSYKFVVSEIAKDPRYSKEEKEQILKTIKERGGEKYIEQVAGKEQRDENDTAENAVRYQFEELFARGFEKYLQTGKAPVAKLNGLFAKVRKWMLKVYKKLALNPNIELSEEVTDMFNALIVADETIDTWFKSPRIKAAATEGLFADIKDGNIREELKAELFEILKNDIEAKKKLNIGQVRKKAKEAAEKYVKNNPAYKALDSVRYGLKKNPKDAAQDFLNGKLSRNDRLKFEGIYRKYADVFTSSLDMARKLAELPNRAEYVKQAQENAEREALELAIDNPEKLEAFVREIACNNQKNMELGLLELKYLEERLNSLEQDNSKEQLLQKRKDGPEPADRNTKLKVFKVTKNPELLKVKNNKELIAKVKDLFKKCRNIVVKSTGISILFSNVSAERDVSKNGKKETVHNTVYGEMETLVSNAVYAGFVEADDDHKDKVQGQDVYYTLMQLDNRVYGVEFKVDVPYFDYPTSTYNYAGHKVKDIKIVLAAKAESTESLTYRRVSSENQNSPLGVEQSESNISLAEIIKKFNNRDKAKVQAESRLYLNAMKNRFKTMAAEYICGKVLRQAGNIENKAPKGPVPLTNRKTPLEDTISIEEMMSGIKDRKQQNYILKPVINTRQLIYADKNRPLLPVVLRQATFIGNKDPNNIASI